MKLKAEIGFVNAVPPTFFQKKPVYMCLLAETSDGYKIHFCRIRYVLREDIRGDILTPGSAKKVGIGQSVLFSAQLTEATQLINCFVMCDDIGK